MMLKAIWRDLRYGVRILGKNSGFTALAAILAVGIDALNPGGTFAAVCVVYQGIEVSAVGFPIVGLDVNLVTVRWYEFLVGYERSHEIRT